MRSEIELFADQIVWIFLIIAAGYMVITLTIGLSFGYFAKRLAVKR